jgi:hypothetical protein
VIEMTRRQAAEVRSLLRRTFGISSTARAPRVEVLASPDGLAFRCASNQIAFEYRFTSHCAPDGVILPYAALTQCEARRDDVVRIQQDGDEVELSWSEDGIPQTGRFPTEEPHSFPDMPADRCSLNDEFLTAMYHAAATTDEGSSRYALSCIRLRSSDGQVAATDSRQAFLQSGFAFPWPDERLVPACGLFGTRQWRSAEQVEVGSSDEWVTFHADRWTLHLKTVTDATFPAVDELVPAASAATTTMSLTNDDAEFLTRAIKRLPGGQEQDAPLTLDLNGSVVVRACGSDQAVPTEVALSNSQRIGDEVRLSTNRSMLARAIELGFRDVHFRGADAPAFCREDRRAYLWALLGGGDAVEPNEQATRIESPVGNSVRRRRAGRPSTERGIRRSQRNDSGRPANASSNPSTTPLLTQAETLRDSLKQVLSQTRELVSSLKKQKQEKRLVASTLKSLRQLEQIGA